MTLRAVPDDASEVLDLPQLIRAGLDKPGMSLEKLAARTPGVLNYDRWRSLSKGEKLTQFPKVETLAAIAHGLRVPETTVVVAAAKSVGMNVSRRSSPFAQRLPAGTDDLPNAMQTALLTLIDAAQAMNAPYVVQDAAHPPDSALTDDQPEDS